MCFTKFFEERLKEVSEEETLKNLGDRSSYIGASDVAGCLLKAYWNKKEEVEYDVSSLIRFERGHIAENIIKKVLNGKVDYEYQLEITDNISDVEIRIHPDFVVKGRKEIVVLEIKTTNNIPEMPYQSWVLQLQFQMGFIKKINPNKAVRGILVAIDLSGDVKSFEVEYNDELFEVALARAEKLANAMKNGEIEGLAEEQLYCSSCPFKSKCPLFQAEEIKEEVLLEDVEMLKNLKKQKKEVEDKIKEIESQLIEYLNSKEIKKVKVGNNVVSVVKGGEYETLDTTSLKKDPIYEELLKKYKKTYFRKDSLRIK